MNTENPTNDEIVIKKNATNISQQLANGKMCKLFDNTCTISNTELEELLTQLMQDKHFGIHALSSSDGIIYLDKPKLSHIQIKEELYRLYLYRYHAIIESF